MRNNSVEPVNNTNANDAIGRRAQLLGNSDPGNSDPGVEEELIPSWERRSPVRPLTPQAKPLTSSPQRKGHRRRCLFALPTFERHSQERRGSEPHEDDDHRNQQLKDLRRQAGTCGNPMRKRIEQRREQPQGHVSTDHPFRVGFLHIDFRECVFKNVWRSGCPLGVHRTSKSRRSTTGERALNDKVDVHNSNFVTTAERVVDCPASSCCARRF